MARVLAALSSLAVISAAHAAAGDATQAMIDALQLTPAQQAAAVCLSQHDVAQCPAVTLTAAQQAELAKVAPGLKVTPQLISQLRSIALDSSRSIDDRVAAMQKLTGIRLKQPVHLTVCIWDIAGRLGPIFTAAQEQRDRILKFGIDADMVAYTSESVMVQALKAGRCDAALMSGLRARSFNKYTGTIDAVGGLESLKQMKLLQQVLASPRLADRMVSGRYVVMGIAPAGGAYLFVDDRRINSLAKAAGKKVAVLDYDKVQAQMVAGVGATPVPTDIVEAPNMFNNHVVDVLPAPLVAYQPLELYKGMTPNGGIIRLPIAQLTMQLIGRSSKIPNIAAQLVREAFYEGFDRITARLRQETDRVPAHWWIDIPSTDKDHYQLLMQQARMRLRDRGYYDADMLHLEKRVRCKFDPTRAKCSDHGE